MKYEYDVDGEYFVREDGLGKKFHINITEARRIMTMANLGNSIAEIRNKISFSSDKVYESTINNFINQVEKGNIDLNGDYPAPKVVLEDLTFDERITELENRVQSIEDRMNELKDDCFISTFAGKDYVEHSKKTWRERLGL